MTVISQLRREDWRQLRALFTILVEMQVENYDAVQVTFS